MSDPKASDVSSAPALSRRNLLASGAVAGAGMLASNLVPSALASAVFHGSAQTLKVGLIGAGGRGRGALNDCYEAAKQTGLNIELVGVADWWEGAAKQTAEERGLDASKAWSGGEGYKRVCETDADLILTAACPIFRPTHYRAIVEAGKHCFMEKPVAVDPVGVRHMLESGKMADEKKLCVVAGTQRRHDIRYQAQKKALEDGKLGEIVGGEVSWLQGALWVRPRQESDSNADYLVRNWVNFLEMSGDIIAEQHVHNIDIALWFLGRTPRAAVSFGDRSRRVSGNDYDFFSTDFDFGDGVHIHSMCRQIDGCVNNVGEHFLTSKGQIWGERRMVGPDGPLEIPGDAPNPYVNEHVALQKAIMNGEHVNETEAVTNSTAAAIMGRLSAYSGQRVMWDDMLTNENSQWYNHTCGLDPLAFETSPDGIDVPEEETSPEPGNSTNG